MLGVKKTVGLTRSPLQFWNLFHIVWKKKKQANDKPCCSSKIKAIFLIGINKQNSEWN